MCFVTRYWHEGYYTELTARLSSGWESGSAHEEGDLFLSHRGAVTPAVAELLKARISHSTVYLCAGRE